MKLNIKKIISVSLIMVLVLFLNLRVNSEDINTASQQPDQEIMQEGIISVLDNNTYAAENNSILPEDNNSPLEINNITLMNNLNGTNITELNPEEINNTSENVSIVNPENNQTSLENTAPSQADATIENNNGLGTGLNDNIPQDNSTYIPLNLTDNNSSNLSKSLEIQRIDLYDGGKLQFIGIPENYRDKIKKFESVKSVSEKEVIINSTEHLNESIIVYTDIPEISESQKSNLEIYWVNEGQRINQEDIKFYHIDPTDNNSLYDGVSWTVPHLSEQIFRVIINYSSEQNDSNTNINLNLISPENNSVIKNPINFKFNISYYNISNLRCSLGIDGFSDLDTINSTTENINLVWNKPLSNGVHNWIFDCIDYTNNSIYSSLSGNFIVNESFGLIISNKTYFPGDNVSLYINSKGHETKIELISPNNTRISLPSIINGTYPWDYLISSDKLQTPGTYTVNVTTDYFEKPYSMAENFSVGKIVLDSNKNYINENELATIIEYVNSPIEKIGWYLLDFGDNSPLDFNLNYNNNVLNKSLQHTYRYYGNYMINLNLSIGSRIISLSKIIYVNRSIDRSPPEINLIYPDDGDVLNDSSITFSYRASDNIKLANCTFEIYNNTGILGVLVYSKKETNPNNGTKNISVSGIDEGYYSWVVECYDNSSNSQYLSRNFRISFQSQQSSSITTQNSANANSITNSFNYSKSETNSLLSGLKSFSTKQGSYNPDQKEAIEELGISKDLDYYNKRLIQIDQDLSNNVNYIKDISSREARIQELLKEIENISQKIPSDIEIIDKSEFVKNSISNDFINLLSNYLESQNITLNNNQIKDLAEKNYNIQSYLSVSTKVKQVRIKYNNSEKEITLITKKIELKNSSFDKILEIIPKEVSQNPENIVFMSTEKLSGDSIFEISYEDLIDNKLVYYIEGFIDLKKIEKTDTLLYKEFPIKNTGITGFFVLDLNNSIKNSLFYSIIISIILGFLAILFISKKIKIAKWKKEEKVLKIFNLIKEAKRNLDAKNFISAKEKYHEIKDIYPAIPSECKEYIYKNIESIRNDIDKKDISSMIKEYYEAKKQGRESDSKLIYERIKINYKKLPKKYQLRVYKKLFKDSPEV